LYDPSQASVHNGAQYAIPLPVQVNYVARSIQTPVTFAHPDYATLKVCFSPHSFVFSRVLPGLME